MLDLRPEYVSPNTSTPAPVARLASLSSISGRPSTLPPALQGPLVVQYSPVARLNVATDPAGEVVAVGAGMAELGEQLQEVAPGAVVDLGRLLYDLDAGRYILLDSEGQEVASDADIFAMVRKITSMKPGPRGPVNRKRPIFVNKRRLESVKPVLNFGESRTAFIETAIKNEVARRRAEDAAPVAGEA